MAEVLELRNLFGRHDDLVVAEEEHMNMFECGDLSWDDFYVPVAQVENCTLALD